MNNSTHFELGGNISPCSNCVGMVRGKLGIFQLFAQIHLFISRHGQILDRLLVCFCAQRGEKNTSSLGSKHFFVSA